MCIYGPSCYIHALNSHFVYLAITVTRSLFMKKQSFFIYMQLHKVKFKFVPSLEVIKLEYSLKLKKKRNDSLLGDTCPQASNHCTLFELENELKFYNH